MRLKHTPSEFIFNGSISITDNINFVRDILYSNSSQDIRIISLDEDNSIPTNHPLVLGGTCLLPPMDALIAEADGDEQLYDVYYSEHFNDPFVSQFIGALFIFLYNGGNLLFYLPSLRDTTGKKFLQQFWIRYGINIGIVGQSTHNYDISCIPIWLTYIYLSDAMHPFELLYFYPVDALIPDNIMNKLLNEINPLGDTLNEKISFILDLSKKLKEKVNTIVPLRLK